MYATFDSDFHKSCLDNFHDTVRKRGFNECGLALRLRLQLVSYTYPDIRISGYPDVRDPDIFGAFSRFTRVGSKRFWRLHVSRHPDALYAAYSLCVGEIRK